MHIQMYTAMQLNHMLLEVYNVAL